MAAVNSVSRIFLLNEDCLVLILQYLKLPDLIVLDMCACGDKNAQSSSYLDSLQHLKRGNLVDDPCAWSPQSVVWAGRKNLSCLSSSTSVSLGQHSYRDTENRDERDRLLACMDFALGMVCIKCTLLSEVQLQGPVITDGGVAALMAANGAPIREVKLLECFSITDAALATISERLGSSLEELTITKCPVSDAGLIQVITGCPKISSLDLRTSRYHPCTWGSKLSASAYQVTPAILYAIAQSLPSLHSLDCGCFGFVRLPGDQSNLVPSAGFVAIAKACDLRSLWVEHVDINDALLIALGESCPNLSVFGNEMGDIDSHVSDVGITAIVTGCRKLRYIDMMNMRGSTDAGMSALARQCRKLDGFTPPPDITDAGLAIILKTCALLERLYIEQCDALTAASARALAKHGGNLIVLEFRDALWVDDAALLTIAEGCKSLEILVLISYADDDDPLLVTNEGLLAAVQMCSHLEKVSLRGTLVTQEGIDALVRACPGVKVCDA